MMLKVAIKLSSMDRKYKIANQFAVWDKIKISSELTVGSMVLVLDGSSEHVVRTFEGNPTFLYKR